MRALVAMAAVLAFACQKREAPNARTEKAAALAAPRPPQMQVGSAAFHLEIAAVYERFQDPKVAGEHFSRALQSAESSMQRVQAYSGLGRVKEASGDKGAAVDLLERAVAELNAPAAVGGAPAGPAEAPVRDDLVDRLARLYVEMGRGRDAERLYAARLATALSPWEREQLYRREIELYRAAGTLDEKIAERESALARSPQDESALRFLAAAFAGDGMPAPAVPSTSGPSQDLNRQVRVYEQLHRLHPDDMPVRQTLQALFERTGRIDEAVKLAAAPRAATPAECVDGLFPIATPALTGAAEAIRVRMRARQDDLARAETAKLAARGEGVAASLVAAQLYVEQGDTNRAGQVIRQAAQRSRSPEEQRQVAFAREQQLVRFGQGEELKALHAEWQKSSDPCLRRAAEQREDQRMAMTTAAMPEPPRHAHDPVGDTPAQPEAAEAARSSRDEGRAPR